MSMTVWGYEDGYNRLLLALMQDMILSAIPTPSGFAMVFNVSPHRALRGARYWGALGHGSRMYADDERYFNIE